MILLRHWVISLVLLAWSLAAAAASMDINQADAKQLASLDGIGPQKAAAIVAYREANGPFHSVDELAKVKGVGAATVAKNRDRISVAETASAAASN